MKEVLDSDRVNFLIWRYLIEGNYRETAVKFQKEWHIQEPHRQLPFARHVKSHSLVNTLNRGLLYNALEREFTQSQVPQNATAAAEAQLGVFGPLFANPVPQPPVEEHDDEEDAEGEPDLEITRKRPNDRPQNPQLNGGSPAKRQRLSNGYENGVDAATTPMELDGQSHHGDNHAYPSPLEGEQAPTPIPRTDGPEQGTQVDKVEELAPATTFIPLGPDDASGSSPPSGINSENAPVLLHCQWNPRDPTILAAGGTDALARLWTVSRASSTTSDMDPASGHVENAMVPPFHSLVEDDIHIKSTVTAMAWNGEGNAIALATDSNTETKARISLWSADGGLLHHIEVPEAPIIKLRWNHTDTAILAIAPDNGATLVTVYDVTSSKSLSYLLSHHDLDSEPLDCAWTSERDFLLCGGELFMTLTCTDGKIEQHRKYETRGGDSLTQVQFDSRARLVATCGEKGFVDIWEDHVRKREIKAHDDAVTALAWQPLQSAPSDEERLIASGGEDGAIFIWNARSTDGKSKCSMTMGPPIVAMAFTPDGAFIAGATSERILIWKVGDHSIPRATWSRLPHPGWFSPRMNSDSDEEDEHCLCWDSTGQKLAYGVNSRLAVINFR